MFSSKKKETIPVEQMDLDAVMKKFDRESNTRVWEGKAKVVVNCILAAFSLFCIYVTFFATWLDSIRLSSFMGAIVLIGFLVYPAKKGMQRANHIPWYDLVLMLVGSGSFFFHTVTAMTIIQQGNKFELHQIIIGAIGILCLLELCRRCVGIPIIIVAGVFIVYAMGWGLTNPDMLRRLEGLVGKLFYTTTSGILSTPINTCARGLAAAVRPDLLEIKLMVGRPAAVVA
ncbi:MAG: hypothetical protein IKK71_06180, partial [Clostridia bacterium]|nr:hypothetical protein [Clostridia bacterium]